LIQINSNEGDVNSNEADVNSIEIPVSIQVTGHVIHLPGVFR